jgi:hypothetical protein
LQESASHLKEEIGQLQTEQQKVLNVRAELEKLQNEKNQLMSDRSTLQNDLSKTRADLDRYTQECSDLAARAQVYDNELIDKQKQVNSARDEAGDIERQLAERTSELRKIQTELDESEPLIETYRKATKVEPETEAILDKYDKARQHLEEELKKLEHARNEFDTLDDRIQRMRAIESKLKGVNAAGDAPAPEELRKKISGIWKPTLLDGSNSSRFESDEQKCLDGVSQYLKSCNLIFHERTIYAFHTALKVAQEAPLLVLAGISGTGKSLLPKRYSEAMGINFLNVPVQPRWDSPQDLWGFFNYLQNEYVPTEFLRAMIQMHQFPQEWINSGHLEEDNKGEYSSRSEQLLLVLFDEMNLARVEYYFSDFLSKLEFRRTIDKNNAIQRNNVSLPVECGPSITPPSVYPGLNTMFVGTMNEDESTQSVSDKVVDRANVMRFTKPDRLFNSPDGDSSPSSLNKPSDGYLPHKTWEGWCQNKTLNQQEISKITDIVDQLNTALGEARRPFGHRLSQAVSKYVQMYPDHVPDYIDRALADQIEMRILPKMRGIELDETGENALEKIQLITEGLGDAELAEAISDQVAGHSDMKRFFWHGLSRQMS